MQLLEYELLSCFSVIYQQLLSAKQKYLSTRLIEFTVSINEINFNVAFRIDTINIIDVADELCNAHSTDLNIHDHSSMIQCIEFSSEFIQLKVDEFIEMNNIHVSICFCLSTAIQSMYIY